MGRGFVFRAQPVPGALKHVRMILRPRCKLQLGLHFAVLRLRVTRLFQRQTVSCPGGKPDPTQDCGPNGPWSTPSRAMAGSCLYKGSPGKSCPSPVRSWTAVTPDVIGQFSAICYYTGRDIARMHTGTRPLGLQKSGKLKDKRASVANLLDFVNSSTRTRHGGASYVPMSKRNRIDRRSRIIGRYLARPDRDGLGRHTRPGTQKSGHEPRVGGNSISSARLHVLRANVGVASYSWGLHRTRTCRWADEIE